MFTEEGIKMRQVERFFASAKGGIGRIWFQTNSNSDGEGLE